MYREQFTVQIFNLYLTDLKALSFVSLNTILWFLCVQKLLYISALVYMYSNLLYLYQ